MIGAVPSNIFSTPAIESQEMNETVLLSVLEQSCDAAVGVDVDLFGCGNFGKSRHGHDVSGEDNDESSAGGDLHIPDDYSKSLRSA